jgi:hypothetical protein
MSDLDELGRVARGEAPPRLPAPPVGYYAAPEAPRGSTWLPAVAAAVIVGCAVLLVVMISLARLPPVAAPAVPATPPAAPPAQRPAFVNAEDLLNVYDSNQVAGDAQYRDRVLVVHGTVTEIRRDEFGAPYLTFAHRRVTARSVRCYFAGEAEPALARLRPGEEVTVTGRCRGMSGTIRLDDCRVVEAR